MVDFLSMTAPEVAEVARYGASQEQAEARFLLTRIQNRDHRALIAHLSQSGELGGLRGDYEAFKMMPAGDLGALLVAGKDTMTLAGMIAGLFIIQCVANAEPVDLTFASTEGVTARAEYDWGADDLAWISEQVVTLSEKREVITVSEWAELNRYLPSAVTPMPGYYRYSVAPYLREIADCFSVTSPIRTVDFMKSAQIGATVGVFENVIGYFIEHVRSAPCILLTADAELAKIRMDGFIIPMLDHSNLLHLIKSNDENNPRKTGMTNRKLEWAGGGFLLPFGAKNADKLRSVSVVCILEDEVDSYPERIGKDGDPQKLVEARAKAFYETRKIGRISTPLIKGRSRIHKGYKMGDQREYHVPCRGCGEFQTLVFSGTNVETGQAYGLIWKTDPDGVLLTDTVRYICKFCGHEHRNGDKSWMLPRGKWIPGAVSKDPTHRSYRINSLYSPVGMYPWEAIVDSWLECWDVTNNVVRDIGKLQAFYNNDLGEPFEVFGQRVNPREVSAHRRPEYRFGQIPNGLAVRVTGGPILMLTCQVDVHKNNLAVAVMGWTSGMRCFLIDYWRLNVLDKEGDCSEVSSPVWERLADIIEHKEYGADDGKKYRIAWTLIDAGYSNDTVTQFCSRYEAGVTPSIGRDRPGKNQTIKEFSEFTTQAGIVGYKIVVDHYKDRLAPVLRRTWTEAAGLQPPHHFNCPIDATDEQLKELTVETRAEKEDEDGNVTIYWKRPGSATRNELWDLLVYGHAQIEIVAWQICIQHFEAETVDWAGFWEFAAMPENDEIFGRIVDTE